MTNNINILNSFENQIITQLKKDLSTQSNNSQIFSFITPLPKVNNPWKIIDGMKKLSTYSCFWSNQSENNWISSAGKTIELKTNAINPYIEIKEKYKKIQPMISIYSFGLNNEKPNPLCFSGFSFETKILNNQDIWHDFPNGLVTLPTYTIEHKNDKTTLTIYPTANSTAAGSNNKLAIWYTKRIEDVGDAYTNATDVPYRFTGCMTTGLAFYLAQKYAPQRAQEMKLYYEDELARALQEDGSASSAYVTPKAYYPAIT